MPPTSPPLPPHVVVAVSRLARRIAADATPRAGRLRAFVVGLPDWRTLTILDAALGSVTVVPGEELDRITGGYEVAVALDWLHRLRDPDVGLETLRRAGPAHLLLGAPREPLARLGVTFTARLLRRPGTAWSAPGFIRFASRAGAVRDVAHPLGWSILWIKRN